GEEVQPLALHLAATPALHAPHLEFQVNARIAAGKIAHPSRSPVVPAHLRPATAAAQRFFERRRSVTTRAFGSPKTPRTVGRGRNPGKAYASQSRRRRFVEIAMQTCSQFRHAPEMPRHRGKSGYLPRQFTHTTS